MNIARLEVIAGPVDIAYRYVTVIQNDVDHIVGLELYVGAAAKKAPADCLRTKIAAGFNRFLIGDTTACAEHGVEDLCWQFGEGDPRVNARPAEMERLTSD